MTDLDAIREQVRRFIDAYNAGDVDGIMRCYSADLVKTRQGAAPESYAETETRLRTFMQKFAGQLTVVNDELVVAGDLAYTRGSLTISITPRDGGAAQLLERRFLEIWRKEGGEWRVARTMDNTP